ncbi:phytase [Pseudoxanthomonas koreensis]|uniref:phytase n=1 Tax=Pseudoxanthomonas koreensis TaxID=266061 RepID=UPI001390E74A|nr:phytase [Pseudoxanthomonas koreensis]KAF1692910.1 phytase [Pseudoxanthomonas koreensis]
MSHIHRSHVLVLALGLALAGCRGTDAPAAADASPPAATGADAPAADARALPVVEEAFITAMTPEDNIDSPAAWTAPDGSTWLIATAKATDKLVVYDGATGETLRTFGTLGTGPGQFDRPNGIAVIDDLLFVVERDNRRVQVLRLPDFGHVVTFAGEDLVKPYGLWVKRAGEGYELYVTDSYDKGEDAQGNDILPPLAELDRRIHRYALEQRDGTWQARPLGPFGDTTPEGALRVVESLWGDAANDRLLVAEEDETYANELKVYDLAGRFTGTTVGRDVFQAQAEGIMLKACADGSGWWITTEQGKGRTVFHLFDRRSLAHVGAVAGAKVANTDGIWMHDVASARFPEGVLYAVHDDQGVVALDWSAVAGALELPACPRS